MKRGALAGVALAVVAVAGAALNALGDDGPNDAERRTLEAAAASAGDDALAALVEMTEDEDRWDVIVADGGIDLARALDRAQGPLGLAEDPASIATPIVAPLLDGDSVDDEARTRRGGSVDVARSGGDIGHGRRVVPRALCPTPRWRGGTVAEQGLVACRCIWSTGPTSCSATSSGRLRT